MGSRSGPGTGLSAIALRRWCLAVVGVGAAITIAYHPDLSRSLLAGLLLLAQGTVVSGALQRVRRNVKVGYAATATALATSALWAVGLLLVPHQVGSRSILVPSERDPANVLVPARERIDVDTYSSPVLALFGRRSTVSTSPELPLSIVTMFVAIVGSCVLWAMVARLGRDRGVLDAYVGEGGLASGATLPEPLGTGITRPAAATRPARPVRADPDDHRASVGQPFPTTATPLRLPPRLPGKRPPGTR